MNIKRIYIKDLSLNDTFRFVGRPGMHTVERVDVEGPHARLTYRPFGEVRLAEYTTTKLSTVDLIQPSALDTF